MKDKNVLVLNKHWVAIGVTSAERAICSMFGEHIGDGACALDIEYELASNGKPIYGNAKNIIPTIWEEWKYLEVRDWDDYISTTNSYIRLPTIIVAKNYDQVPKKRPKPTKSAIWERDQGICQISNKKLTKKTGNIGHLKARARGGQNTWTNLVLMDKELNTLQKTKSIEEMGWTLIRQPTEPHVIPMSALIRRKYNVHPDWELFLQ